MLTVSAFIFRLCILGPPAITQLSDEVGGMENQDLRIPCEANGWPKPNIQWKTEDGVYINDDNKYGIEANPTLDRVTLLIKAANSDHEGEYFCEASNSYGTVEDSVYVMVQRKFLYHNSVWKKKNSYNDVDTLRLCT